MKKFKQFTAGALCGMLMMTTVPGIAKVGKQTISVVYNNIKLEVNGIKADMPKGVEPFIYNGTTYLPVNAIAEALGENVEYDRNSNTVYVGSKKQASSDGAVDILTFLKKNKPLVKHNIHYSETYDGNAYVVNRNEKISIDSAIYSKWNSASGSEGNMDITLNSNYSKFSMDFIIPDNINSGSFMVFDNTTKGKKVLASSKSEGNSVNYADYYGDIGNGIEKMSFAMMEKGSKVYHVDIDVVGVDTLTIEVDGEGVIANGKLTPLN